MTKLPDKALYYGDNLDVLRKYIPDESIDLIYLDPPFNSKADYNVIFREPKGQGAQAQITAFEDTWHWGDESNEALNEILQGDNPQLAELMDFFVRHLGKNDLSAYLIMIAIRLVELHRVLKSTGSLYLHADPTASHYLKVILDAIFGAKNFRNEIIWKRTYAHAVSRRKWAAVHDVILFYTKSDDYTWNPVYLPYDDEYIEKNYKYEDEHGKYQPVSLMAGSISGGDSGKPWRGIDPTARGRNWAIPTRLPPWFEKPANWDEMSTQERLDELDRQGLIHWPKKKGGVPRYKFYLSIAPGVLAQDVIIDIPPLSAHDEERLGYPTQKPVALLERFISASSNPGDIVLDPFCGCGTAVVAAEKLGRRWIGIDITHLAITLIQARLKRDFNLEPGRDYKVFGIPEDIGAAKFLWEKDPFQFEYWAVGLVGGVPLKDKKGKHKRGKDKGIDGILHFRTPGGERLEKAIISVKGGRHLTPSMVRDLLGTMEREKAKFGIFITLQEPTKGVREEAARAGIYSYGDNTYPRLQVLTIEELLKGKKPKLPASENVSLARGDVKTGEKEGSKKHFIPLFDAED